MAICKVEGCGRDEKYLAKGLCNRHYAKLQRTGTLEYTPRTNAQKGIFACSNPTCPEDPASVKRITKGLCKNCYYRKWHTGNVDYQVRERRPCKIGGCGKLAVAKGLCDTHRKRVDRHGSVEKGGRPEGWGQYTERKKRSKDADFKRKFGKDKGLDEYNRILAEQGGVCDICKGPETRVDFRTGKVIEPAWDHDDGTNKTRGILCASHNKGIGLFKHRTDWLANAIIYLAKHDQTATKSAVIEEAIRLLNEAKI